MAHVPIQSLFYEHAPGPCYRFTVDGKLDADNGLFKGDVESLRAAVAGLPDSIDTGDLYNIPAPPSRRCTLVREAPRFRQNGQVWLPSALKRRLANE